MEHVIDPAGSKAFVGRNLFWSGNRSSFQIDNTGIGVFQQSHQGLSLHKLAERSAQTSAGAPHCRMSGELLRKNRLLSGQVHDPLVRVDPLFPAAGTSSRTNDRSINMPDVSMNQPSTNKRRAKWIEDFIEKTVGNVPKRSQTVPHFPNSKGQSHNGALVRMIHRIPLTTWRRSNRSTSSRLWLRKQIRNHSPLLVRQTVMYRDATPFACWPVLKLSQGRMDRPVFDKSLVNF